MIEFAPTLALGALVLTIVNVLKYARAGDFNGVFTQFAAWVAGVGAIMLAAQTDFAGAIPVGTITLAQANAWSQVFIGVTVAAAGSFGAEALKAVDKFQTAAKPDLIPSADKSADVVVVPAPPAPPQG